MQNDVIEQLRGLCIRAQEKITSGGEKYPSFRAVKQGQKEQYADFIALLWESLKEVIADSDAQDIVLELLTFDNANTECQLALLPIRGKAHLVDYIKACEGQNQQPIWIPSRHLKRYHESDIEEEILRGLRGSPICSHGKTDTEEDPNYHEKHPLNTATGMETDQEAVTDGGRKPEKSLKGLQEVHSQFLQKECFQTDESKDRLIRACSDYPTGWDTWRPNRDLETRDSVRKRTPKDGRPLTKTKGVKLFRSPREPAASESKKMKPNMKFLWRIIALYNTVTVYAGFGDPRKAKELLRKQYGQPCDCRGGQISEPPSDRITQVTCTGKTAYLMPNQLWKCKSTPRDTSPSGPLLECPCSSFQSSVHSSCYTSYQQCKSGNRTYYTATLLKTQTGGINDVQVLGSTNKLVQSPCNGQKGKPVC
nr:uncharacterized protein LOC123570965 [Macaca fascicularis]